MEILGVKCLSVSVVAEVLICALFAVKYSLDGSEVVICMMTQEEPTGGMFATALNSPQPKLASVAEVVFSESYSPEWKEQMIDWGK